MEAIGWRVGQALGKLLRSCLSGNECVCPARFLDRESANRSIADVPAGGTTRSKKCRCGLGSVRIRSTLGRRRSGRRQPPSRRAQDGKRQTELLQTAWTESGKVHGCRKLHDDLLEHGESACPNRVARLTRLAGITAQIDYKRRPGTYGGKPSVVIGNILDRPFDVDAPDRAWDEPKAAIGKGQ